MTITWETIRSKARKIFIPVVHVEDSDVGSSSYLSPFFHIGTRLGTFLFLVIAQLAALSFHGYNLSFDWRPWTSLIVASSFAFLTFATYQVCFFHTPSWYVVHCAPPIHLIACVLSWATLSTKTLNDWGEPSRFLPLSFVIFDFFLGCKIRFRLWHIAMLPICVVPAAIHAALIEGKLYLDTLFGALRLMSIGFVIFAFSNVQDLYQQVPPPPSPYNQIV